MWEESFRITTKEEITLFRGKKYKDSAKLVDRSTQYEVPAAMDLVVKTASAKFDETVEVHIKLGVDSRHADQQVRGAIVLPNGTGKTRKVLVFAKDAKLDEAKEAGADFAGGMELVEKIQKENWFDFDVVVATPDMMGIVGRLGKVLGPKGLMPSPNGKASFGPEKLAENFNALMGAVIKAKPAAAKGQYIRSCTVASTMGPGIKVAATKI